MLKLMEITNNQPVEKNEWREEFPKFYNFAKKPQLFLWDSVVATDKWLKRIIIAYSVIEIAYFAVATIMNEGIGVYNPADQPINTPQNLKVLQEIFWRTIGFEFILIILAALTSIIMGIAYIRQGHKAKALKLAYHIILIGILVMNTLSVGRFIGRVTNINLSIITNSYKASPNASTPSIETQNSMIPSSQP